jgi:dihydrodipicolinate synthase/N-acetylneuraminate lyase
MSPEHLSRRSFLKHLGVGAAAMLTPFGCDRMHTLAPGSAAGNAAESAKNAGTLAGSAVVKDFAPAMGMVPPMITPMNQNLSINYDALNAVVDWHTSQGVSGVFLASGSGEYFHLTEDEVAEMSSRVVAHTMGDVPVLVGATNHLAYSQAVHHNRVSAFRNGGSLEGDLALWEQDVADNTAMAQRISATGVDGIFITVPMAVPYELFSDWDPNEWIQAHTAWFSSATLPLYQRLQADLDEIIVEYYTTIHDAVSCSVYGYEMPGTVYNYKFSANAFAALGQLSRTIAVKDTTVSIDAVRAKAEAAAGTILVMDANVDNLYDTLQLGSSGSVNTTSNVASGLFVRMQELIDEGRLSTAQILHQRIRSVDGKLMDHGEYSVSAKVALWLMGLPVQRWTRTGNRVVDLDRLRDMVDLIRLTRQQFGAVTPTGIAS